MSLSELERLIRRIEQALDKATPAGTVAKLAEDYAAACRAAALRLQQCAALQAAGDERQALQLAETAPALLDQLTLLAFRRSPDWKAHCSAEGLAAAAAFDIQTIRKLHGLFAAGIGKDHALYREYRRAVTLNDDARAIESLRSIVRVNGSDQNAREELGRLERKRAAERGKQLERMVRGPGQDPGAIARLMEEMERSGQGAEIPCWEEAQSIRARFLLGKAEAARVDGDLEKAEQAAQAAAKLSGALEESERARLDALQRWAVEESARLDEADRRKAATGQLNSLVNQLEQTEAGAPRRSQAELRAAADSLERAWRQVEILRGDVGAAVATRTEKVRRAIDAEINRRARASRLMAIGLAGLAVAALLAVAWIALARQAERALASRLEGLVRERKVAEAEAALGNSSKETGSAALAEARTKTVEFLARERGLAAAAARMLAQLEEAGRAGFTNAPPERTAAAFEATRAAIVASAPEFQGPAEVAFAKLELGWQQFLDREKEARTARLATLLEPLERAAERELQFSFGPNQVAKAAERLRASLGEARPLVEAPIPALKPKQEALFRFERLEAKIGRYAEDAAGWLDAQRRLGAATNLAGHHEALQRLATNGFTPEGLRATASSFAARPLTAHSVLEPLLLPNGPAGALGEEPRASRFPDEMLPAEREILRRLRDDENVQQVQRLEIEEKARAADDPKRRRIVYVRGELTRRITRKAGQIYDPMESPAALRFAPKEMASLDYVVEEPRPTPERELYERCGLPRLLDSNTGRYQVSLLQALDEINADRKASPVFRAWLFAGLCEMIDAQPLQWGAPWSPALARDRAELGRKVGQQIHSGDWLVPAVNARLGPALSAHFDRAAPHSYSRQASFFKRLFPEAVRAGVTLVGHVSGDGEIVLYGPRSSRRVWGFTEANSPATLLFNRLSPTEKPTPKAPPLPLTPLFVFGGDAGGMVDSTLQSLGYSAAGVGIPEWLPAILAPAPR